MNLKDLKISTRVLLGFGFIMIFNFAVTYISFLNSSNLIEQTSAIVSSEESLIYLTELKKNLIDLETSQRGFIITGNEAYLTPYYSSLFVIEEQLTNLQGNSTKWVNQELIDSLEILVSKKIEELQTTIELRKLDDGFIQSKRLVETNWGNNLMLKIREIIRTIIIEEKLTIEEIKLNPQKSVRNTLLVYWILLAFSIVVSITIAVVTSKSVTMQVKALQKRIAAVSAGNLIQRKPMNSESEIGQLSASFEKMLAHLNETLASKRELEAEILERKKIEFDLQEITKDLKVSREKLLNINDTRNKFFTLIAHDLRGPLSSLIEFSGMLKADFDIFTKKEIKTLFGELNGNVKGLLQLLDDLIIWSRIQNEEIRFNPETVKASETLDNVVRLFRLTVKQKKITIKKEIQEGIILFVDQNMLSTIFRNLLGNGIKFTPPMGEIKIKSGEIFERQNQKYIWFFIHDTGIGMSEKELENIFDFSTRVTKLGTNDEKGSGLGLEICKDFIGRCGGEISVSSEVGQGTTFQFFLPLA